MFVRSEIVHTLRLPPHLLNRPLNVAVKGELESLFLDKVIGKLGLCVSVYDILSIDGGFIFPGDGASTYTARFRLVMFRPYVGEVISARLKESTKDGLRLSLGFFNDIYVPIPLMPNPCHIEPDPEHKNGIKWVWEYMGENYPIDWTDEIRFSVHSVNYPPIPIEQGKDSEEKGLRAKDIKPFAPMVITVVIEKIEAGVFVLILYSWGSNTGLCVAKAILSALIQPCEFLTEDIGLKKFECCGNTGSLDADGLGPTAWWV